MAFWMFFEVVTLALHKLKTVILTRREHVAHLQHIFPDEQLIAFSALM